MASMPCALSARALPLPFDCAEDMGSTEGKNDEAERKRSVGCVG